MLKIFNPCVNPNSHFPSLCCCVWTGVQCGSETKKQNLQSHRFDYLRSAKLKLILQILSSLFEGRGGGALIETGGLFRRRADLIFSKNNGISSPLRTTIQSTEAQEQEG